VSLSPILERLPNLAIALWRDAVIDGGIYRQWLTGVGRRTAKQRVAHLICETFDRMEAVGLTNDDHFSFPVTQAQMGDALGLSPVHVNRTVQELRQESLITWKGGVMGVPVRQALERAGDYDPTYLRLRPRNLPH
jgi:CRP-like cAMP-binding protein